ncbi:MAG: amidohydrolase family protein [Flavobacteriales bacterium]|nr:amidohydrolase family protein [Flavobacteriales bacterium]
MKKYSILLILCVVTVMAWAQPTPGSKQTKSILIVGATAHMGNGEVVEESAIGFKDGIIKYAGPQRGVNQAEYDEIIDATGKHVYPGFIAPNSTLGLQEIGAVRATRDQYETGTFRPNVRSIIAFNTESEVTPTVRTNGVLIGQITPRGGIISGSSSIVHFDGWNWEDAAIEMVDGVHLNWPYVHHRHSQHGKTEFKKRKTYDQTKQEITRFFTEAKAYCEAEQEITEVKYEAMCGLFNGEHRLYVHANDIKQITEAVHFKRTMGIEHMVIIGGYDSHLVTDLLNENNVSVMIQRVHSLPRFDQDDVDLPYKLPALLQEAGVMFCIENAGDMEQMGTRNLPFYGGTAVAYGLEYEEAVMAMTLNTAKILGVDDRLGSLEKEKDATLFISTGDALDMRTNDVTHAYIQGRAIDLDNRQLQLYRKYKAKYDN